MSRILYSILLAWVVVAARASDDDDDEEEGLTLKASHDYCIVGGGPAGLQMAFHMAKQKNDFILLERSRPGVKFETQPVHRDLISINKRFTSQANPVFNERHDWNSILSDDEDLLMTKYTKDYYPKADVYVKYLRDYSEMVEGMLKDDTVQRMIYGGDVVRLHRQETVEQEVGADGKASKIKRTSSASESPLILDVALTEEAASKYYNDASVEGLELTCKDLIWATGFIQNPIDEIPGYDLPGVERYIDVDATNERYENETVLIIGNGNAGLETAKALQNSAGKVTVVFRTPLKFSWRTHYVGHARSVNLAFIDGYLLKSLDLLDSYPCPTEGIYIQQKNITNPYTGRPILEYRCSMAEKMAEMQGQGGGDEGSNDENVDLTSKPEFLTETRLAAETNRFHNQGFDRIIFATGFRFDADARIFRDVTVRPKVDANHKFPVMNADYQSTNVASMHFAGALAHGRDYKRGAGGFIHGFRYTTKSLFHILMSKKHGAAGWPSKPMTKEEVANGTHTYRRVNEAAGTYQMFGELCDLLVFADGEQCRPETDDADAENDEPYARYYEEVPLSYAHIFVRQILKKLRFVAVCYDYGHGKFSNMSPFSAEYIGKRQGPIYRSLGIGGNSPNEELQSFNFGMGLKASVDKLEAPHHDQGTTGGGLDSNFLHPILAYYELHNTKSYSRISQRSMRDKLRAKAVMYPVANHHMLEDVETMFDLFFTHRLPMMWWLKDRVDCIGAPRARWLNAKGKPKVRVPRKLDEIHVELMGRDYETARFNVRQQESQMEGRPFHFTAPADTKGSIFRKGYESGQGPQDDLDPSGDDLPGDRSGSAKQQRMEAMMNAGKNGPGMPGAGGQQGMPGMGQAGGAGGMPGMGQGMGGGMPGGGMGGGMPGMGQGMGGGMPGGGMGGGMPGGGMGGGMPGGGMGGGMPGGGMGGGMPGGGMGGGMPGMGQMGGRPGGNRGRPAPAPKPRASGGGNDLEWM
jgi:hypothetical protein